MKKIRSRCIHGILIAVFCLPVLNNLYAQEENSNSKKAVQILQAVNAKLNELKTISYNYKRDYFDGYEHTISEANKYIEFNEYNGNSKPEVLRCIMYSPDGDTIVFNGSEYFHVVAKTRNINIALPAESSLDASSFFYYSLASWRNSLNALIADATIKKTIRDSVVNNEPCNIITLTTHKKVLAYTGGIYEVTDDITFTFKIAVSVKTQWPLFTMVSNNANKHRAIVYYKNIQPNVKPPNETLFFFSSYAGNKIFMNQTASKFLPVDTKAPDFTVPSIVKDQTISLEKVKGKITIVEFFIKNCGPCIAAVPELNKLQQKYGDKLAIITLNPTDKLPAVEWFIKEYKPNYPIGINALAVANQFGVQSFPATFILDESGTIVYVGRGFDKAKIEEVIKKAL
jgi:thiol-disulfide isomerase/thioredoxin/outer membrane lipoprotein-sorting protein